MFTTPTTIILGAGASYEFGAPLGESLWEQVVKSARKIPDTYAQFVEKNWSYSVPQLLESFRHRDPRTYAYLKEVIAIWEDEPLVLDQITKEKDSKQKFSRDLHAILKIISNRIDASNVHSSVDDFLRDNPSLLRPLRVLIAATIFEGLYERDGDYQHRWKPKKYWRTARFNSPHDSKVMVDNWLLRFVGMCRPMLIGAKEIVPVTVVSFNYDLLMQAVLSEYWERSERQFPSFEKCFTFIFPYGRFVEFPESVQDAGEWLRVQAGGIGLAGDSESPETRATREALSSSRQIFSIGFSFTEANLRLLNISEKHSARLFVQNYENKDARLSRTLKRFPKASSDSASIAQLVRDGFFEQVGPAPRYQKI